MGALRSTAAGAAALVLASALAACGSSGPQRPNLAKLPLVSGAHVVVRAQQCDPGAAAYCAIQFVVVDPGYRTLDQFITAERDYLHKHGWTGANGDTGEESAADSPGHKLHLTYATASGDLDGLIFHWIRRPWPIWNALTQSMWNREAALSMMLEVGSGAT
jgi:hypothetical protein